MLRLDQVPLEVKRAMRAAWARRNNSDPPEKHVADLAVAAINAWPGMGPIRADQPIGDWCDKLPAIILPLPPENQNG